MVKRRSLDDALTPEQQAFIQAGSTTTPRAREGGSTSTIPKRPGQGLTAPTRVDSSAEAALPANAKPELVDLHTRVETWINAALLRASTERKIQRVTPYTQRDIVAEALSNWLQFNGYLQKP